MHITGVGTAHPEARYTKAECLQAFEESDWFARLDSRAHFIARTVLQRDNGIDARRLAVDTLADVFTIDADTLSRRFLQHAPALAAQAGARAMSAAGLSPSQIDAVVVSTCTGYVCPGLSGHVIERLGLRGNAQAYDLVGQGCAAALPNMQLGHALLATGRSDHVLSVCVEVSSAAMYLDNDPGVLISACLFGDGAGAAVLSNKHVGNGRRVAWKDSTSLTEPGHRSALMFEQRSGLLRNVLTRAVPALAAQHAQRVLVTVLGRAGLNPGNVSAWLMHAGGRDVLLALQNRLELEPQHLRYSAAMLREYGNLSSAFVYFVLQAALGDCATGSATGSAIGSATDGTPDGTPGGKAGGKTGGAAGGWWWLSSFGAGFSCHGALLEVQ